MGRLILRSVPQADRVLARDLADEGLLPKGSLTELRAWVRNLGVRGAIRKAAAALGLERVEREAGRLIKAAVGGGTIQNPGSRGGKYHYSRTSGALQYGEEGPGRAPAAPKAPTAPKVPAAPQAPVAPTVPLRPPGPARPPGVARAERRRQMRASAKGSQPTKAHVEAFKQAFAKIRDQAIAILSTLANVASDAKLKMFHAAIKVSHTWEKFEHHVSKLGGDANEIVLHALIESPHLMELVNHLGAIHDTVAPHLIKSTDPEKVHTVMHEFKHGRLRSGSKKGPRVKNRKQAIAIAMSEAGMAKARRLGMWAKLPRTGEGSRGGHVIGHTGSGKPIYERPYNAGHATFTRQDHLDAAELHTNHSNNAAMAGSNRTAELSSAKAAAHERLAHDPAAARRAAASQRVALEPQFESYREEMEAGHQPDRLQSQDNPTVLGHRLDPKTLTPERKRIDVNRPGDYGADPLGNGMHRMVPSGDVVDQAERQRRLRGSFTKAATGEGSRGGHILGHTKSGKPIYSAMSEQGRKTHGLVGKGAPHERIVEQVGPHFQGWSAQDHDDAAGAHSDHLMHLWRTGGDDTAAAAADTAMGNHAALRQQANAKEGIGYFQGDKIKYTGKLNPGGFHEFTYVEGRKKGKTGYTPHGPGEHARPAPAEKKPVTPQIGGVGAPARQPMGQMGLFKKSEKTLDNPRSPFMPVGMRKATGEGSRGGHVIGHTRSGKPIYEPTEGGHLSQFAGHIGHAHFTAQDHHDAAALHHRHADNAMMDGFPATAALAREKAHAHERVAWVPHSLTPPLPPWTSLATVGTASTLDTPIATTILEQLGGSRFRAMTGARGFLSGDRALSFKLPTKRDYTRNGINHVRVRLEDNDTYVVTFSRVRGMAVKQVSEHHGVTVDNLRDVFEHATGLATSLGTMGKAAGEGSRGGHVVGHTKSGKPIYHDSHRPEQHRGWSVADHYDAQQAHHAAGTKLLAHIASQHAAGKLTEVDTAKQALRSPAAHRKIADFHIGMMQKLRNQRAEWKQQDAASEEYHQGDIDHDLDKPPPRTPIPDDMRKAKGEGSRGGKVIGHTRSGKPVYEPTVGSVGPAHDELAHMAKHPGFSVADHRDAAKLHHEKADDYEGSRNYPDSVSTARTTAQKRALAGAKAHRAIAKKHDQTAADRSTPSGKEIHLTGSEEEWRAKHADFTPEDHQAAMEHHYNHLSNYSGEQNPQREQHHAWHEAALPPDKWREVPAMHIRPGDTYRHYGADHMTLEHHRVSRVERRSDHPEDRHYTVHTEDGQHVPADKHSRFEVQRTGAPEMAKGVDMRKAGGEGSRGGKITGHTRSGKPIYQPGSHDDAAVGSQGTVPLHGVLRQHAATHGFTRADHTDAARAHRGMAAAHRGQDAHQAGLHLAAAEWHQAQRPQRPTFAKAAGEGSRGGRIVGHTRSGKPVYDKFSHAAHSSFTADEHHDAARVHHGLAAAAYKRATDRSESRGAMGFGARRSLPDDAETRAHYDVGMEHADQKNAHLEAQHQALTGAGSGGVARYPVYDRHGGVVRVSVPPNDDDDEQRRTSHPIHTMAPDDRDHIEAVARHHEHHGEVPGFAEPWVHGAIKRDPEGYAGLRRIYRKR